MPLRPPRPKKLDIVALNRGATRTTKHLRAPAPAAKPAPPKREERATTAARRARRTTNKKPIPSGLPPAAAEEKQVPMTLSATTALPEATPFSA